MFITISYTQAEPRVKTPHSLKSVVSLSVMEVDLMEIMSIKMVPVKENIIQINIAYMLCSWSMTTFGTGGAAAIV
jgi:hypothetical protein